MVQLIVTGWNLVRQMKLGCERGMGGLACFVSSDLLDNRFVGELMDGHWHCSFWFNGSL